VYDRLLLLTVDPVPTHTLSTTGTREYMYSRLRHAVERIRRQILLFNMSLYANWGPAALFDMLLYAFWELATQSDMLLYAYQELAAQSGMQLYAYC
jgi:hypothetical protein